MASPKKWSMREPCGPAAIAVSTLPGCASSTKTTKKSSSERRRLIGGIGIGKRSPRLLTLDAGVGRGAMQNTCCDHRLAARTSKLPLVFGQEIHRNVGLGSKIR